MRQISRLFSLWLCADRCYCIRVIKPREQYVVSSKGRKVSVLLPVAEYRKLLADLEELESIRAYDAAKASDDETIPFKQAKAELRRRK